MIKLHHKYKPKGTLSCIEAIIFLAGLLLDLSIEEILMNSVKISDKIKNIYLQLVFQSGGYL